MTLNSKCQSTACLDPWSLSSQTSRKTSPHWEVGCGGCRGSPQGGLASIWPAPAPLPSLELCLPWGILPVTGSTHIPRLPDSEQSLQAFSPGTPGQVPSPQGSRACHRSDSPPGRPLPLRCQVGSSPFFTGFQPGPPRVCVVPSSGTQSCLPGPAHTQSPVIGSLAGSSRALPGPLRAHNHLISSSATKAQGHSIHLCKGSPLASPPHLSWEPSCLSCQLCLRTRSVV